MIWGKGRIDGGERRKRGKWGTKDSTFSAPPRSDRDADRIGGFMTPGYPSPLLSLLLGFGTTLAYGAPSYNS